MKTKRLLFLVMAICLASGVKAQIRNSEVLFYHCYDNTIHGKRPPITNPDAGIYIIRVRDGVIESYNKGASFYTGFPLETVVKNLKRDRNYYENVSFFRNSEYKLDSKMTNSKWTVWSKFLNLSWGSDPWPDITKYYAIKNDYSEFMQWAEPDYFRNPDGSEVQTGRYTYKRYTKEQLLKVTFGGRRDFLN